MVQKRYIYDCDLWPNLEWDRGGVEDVRAKVYLARGLLYGKLNALGFSVQNDLLLDSVSDEIKASSQIEGELLNAESVRSSVAKRLGLEMAGFENVNSDHYTEGVVDMALDAARNYAQPLTKERLFNWHAALFPTGRSGNYRINVGVYRTEVMEIVSGPLGKERVHYTAPGPERVAPEMSAFLDWIDTEDKTDPFVKTGLAHLRFETIHPFDDGNGRIGRAIADRMLARAEDNANRYYSLSAQMLAERKAYYNALEEAQAGTGDVTEWLVWFLACLERSIRASERRLDAAIAKALLFERWRGIPMNERQLRMVNMLIDGFDGKLRTSKWATITKCSQDTALRDIDDLVAKGILEREAGGGRSTSYALCKGRTTIQ